MPGALCLFGICCNSFTRMQLGLIIRIAGLEHLHLKLSKYAVVSKYVPLNFQSRKVLSYGDRVKCHPWRSCYTSGRDIFNGFLGNLGYDFVRIGNLLASRMALLIMVASARGCRWLVEQPSGSILESHPRFQHILSIIKVSWLHIYD